MRFSLTRARRKPLFDWRPAALLTFLALPLGRRAEQNAIAMPELENSALPSALPSLSIIIPARNEARNLNRLLPALESLRYPGELEMIVVDDSSTDGTGELAQELGARVLRVEELPEGWHGKPHACHVGALAARGDWLLFTDADTFHSPESATRSVSFARAHALDGLTLFLKHEPQNVFQGAVLMTAFAGLFAGLDDAGALMNGQYILLGRQVYFASGGFEAVRDEPLEDLALGSRLRKLGYIVPALRGENAASVRMYADSAQMWHGMTRLGAGSLKWSGAGGSVTALFTTALVSPLFVLFAVLTGRLRPVWLPLTWLAAAASVIPFARRFGSVWLALLAPFGAFFVLLAAWGGVLTRILGRGVLWKERKV